MLRIEKKTIGDLEITVTQFPALKSFSLLARLGKVIAPALGKVQGLTLESDVSALGPALAELFSRLDEADASALVRDVLASSHAVYDGKLVPLDRAETIDLVFSGRMRLLLEVLRFALEVNYGDFFGGALAAAPDQKAASQSTSTRTLPRRGQRGDSGSKSG